MNDSMECVLLSFFLFFNHRLSADRKSVFSNLKKGERDRQKLLGTVLKHLRQLASIHNDKVNQKSD